MCGYCTEQHALLAVQSSDVDAPTELRQHFLDVYLEEVRDLPSALLKFSTETVTKPDVASIILCRAIDILAVHGFESSVYQELLQLPQFTAAILIACAERTAEFNDMDTRINASGFAWLADKNNYLKQQRFELHSNKTKANKCITLLNKYIDWWLEGGTVKHQDLDQIFDETGILNSIQDIPATERYLLNCRFHAIWFALLKISYVTAGNEILWKIITRNPSGTPDFDGLDLWLQRRAVLAAYDRHGLNPFLNRALSVRIELFQFLAVARIATAEEKQALVAALGSREGFFVGHADKWQWADLHL